jgi:hypothetical protein
MLRQSLVRTALYFVVLLLVPYGASAEVDIPDTPAGHTLRAFLDAFNSAERDRIAAYVKEYDPENSVDGLTSFRNETGGFTLVSIVHSTPDKLSFLVRGRGDNTDGFGILHLASTSPPRVKRISIRAIPPGATPDDIQLDEATRQKTIDAISEKLTEYYVYPDVAEKMIQAIRDHQKHGDYSSMTDATNSRMRWLATCGLSAMTSISTFHTIPSSCPRNPGLLLDRASRALLSRHGFAACLKKRIVLFLKLKSSLTMLGTSSSVSFPLQISADLQS